MAWRKNFTEIFTYRRAGLNCPRLVKLRSFISFLSYYSISYQGIYLDFLYHEDLEKWDGLWYGGARETREPRVTKGDCYQKRTFSRISLQFMILMVS